MPRRRLWIREETRLLGAIQIMTGLIVHFVGQLWTYLFTTQVIAFGKAYLPLVVITRYAYWSSVCFLFSGVFAVLTERMRSTFLMSYTMAVNIVSACAAVIGLLILSFEFIIYSLTTQAPIWPERAQWPIGYTKLNISDNKDVVHGRRGSFSYILKNRNDLSQGGKCSGE
ncbi:membrane-spanning 4-domains subfamily A member 13 isoform X2 [Herpailurus yagouaroundi]|uniref:membrane-spanning 4-domains subfamily A member 13 isoform X2 n=1 Tax=Herpailurus yagouaroundi TaxID=1608482 RepID=UPI001AD79E5A|nr:membrane-spanning 4-domains subfamily A member 13 isoform X2 [Puma yagouaroundi]XP_040350947.1 membrane-spanning 4-domains subfamily A member 13 isoform X2 [Puma yagouaroundi]XP_040350948.1 membrane-spanning 4-domains subfamily A member 13 isoform X2 [Puma yagouaroundi]